MNSNPPFVDPRRCPGNYLLADAGIPMADSRLTPEVDGRERFHDAPGKQDIERILGAIGTLCRDVVRLERTVASHRVITDYRTCSDVSVQCALASMGPGTRSSTEADPRAVNIRIPTPYLH